MIDQIEKFLNRKDDVLFEGNLGLLCNQTSFNYTRHEYLFQSLIRRKNLKRIFIPEHGLFGELQDQISLDSTEIYKTLNLDVEFCSLYGVDENSLRVNPQHLADLDALIIDIQDIGSRFYTFATTISYFLEVIKQLQISIEIYVIDRPNPCGRQVEGTILQPQYASFVGFPGLPHKHGLTVGELCHFYQDQIGGFFKIHIIQNTEHDNLKQRTQRTWEIAPSPNMPGLFTPLVYTGQCLLEGTNLSEGRGTTRPFEIFGAPYLQWIFQRSDYPKSDGAVLRPLCFLPNFHKYSNQICHGFQIHLTGEAYHSLAFSLKILRYIQEHSGENFLWREEVYEFRSVRLEIEYLAGDKILLDYLFGRIDFADVTEVLMADEEKWIQNAKRYLLNEGDFVRIKL